MFQAQLHFTSIFWENLGKKNYLEFNMKHASRLFLTEMNKHYLSYLYVNLKYKVL
jgi:hypothetical protein